MKSLYERLFEAIESADLLTDIPGAEEKERKLEELDEELEKLETGLESAMSDEMKERYYDIIGLRGRREREMHRIFFEKGMRMGVRMMVDAIIEREREK